MFEFDGTEALVMTGGGAGMAFLVLISLMLVTLITRRAVVALSREATVAPDTETDDRQMAAAIAVSLAMADQQKQRSVAVSSQGEWAPGRWGSRGRQDIMDSRLGRMQRG